MWTFVLTISLLCWGTASQPPVWPTVTCRDNNNADVDWFIIYKAPAVKSRQMDGLTYIYIDSNGATETPNNKLINDLRGTLANTLRPLFTPIRQTPATFGYISYSDQPPGGSADQMFGHSKGVLMVDSRNYGVWLLHSTPQFPFRKNMNTFWPPSGAANAQTFICVTLHYNQFAYIGQHLQYIKAFPFDHDIPTNFHRDLREVVDDWIDRQPPSTIPLTIRGNSRVRIFAKNMDNEARNGDLYVAIGRHFNNDVFAQTWGGQPHRDKSFCMTNLPKLYNVKDISNNVGGWKPSCDHSKWCVLDSQNNHWVCIGDVNRSESQYLRRGGALCIEDENAKTVFRDSVVGYENCNTPISTASCDSSSS
ncbi:plancitoxin-1-like isoform X1 [Nelusetta ayraudi]|uniref:plancitoxin-1-like isoform X1 n=1 Tax=Nelusetta ayraudi TaxID=303726 RepID=UPI003F72CCDA